MKILPKLALSSLAVAVLLPLVATGPAAAVTAKQKMETCKFGADDQKLTGAKRKAFIAKCMSNRNDARGPAPAPKTAAKPGMPPPAIMAPEPADDDAKK